MQCQACRWRRPCAPGSAVHRLQRLVHSQTMPDWTTEPAAELLRAVFSTLEALAKGPPVSAATSPITPPAATDRSRIRSPPPPVSRRLPTPPRVPQPPHTHRAGTLASVVNATGESKEDLCRRDPVCARPRHILVICRAPFGGGFSFSLASSAALSCELAATCSPPIRRFFQPGTPPCGRRPRSDAPKHRKSTCCGLFPRGIHFDRYRGVRVGEGPPLIQDQQERALEALARVGIGLAPNRGATLSTADSFQECEPSENFACGADDRSDHSVLGMTPPQSEDDAPGAADCPAVCAATLLDTPLRRRVHGCTSPCCCTPLSASPAMQPKPG